MDSPFWESEEMQDTVTDQEVELYEDSDESLDQSMEEFAQASMEQDDDGDEELLTNVQLRLEQGKLYEMLLKHDIFGNVEADPKAVSRVEKEIRSFIKERLEVLLGLKPDPKLYANNSIPQFEPQFTELEVDLLKRFLAKLSKGATSHVETIPAEPPRSVGLQQVHSSPFNKRLNTVSEKTSKPTTKPTASNRPAPKVTKSETKSMSADQKIKKILEEKFGENETPLGKPAHKMKRSELLERNKRIAERQAARKAAMRVPPAVSPEQENAIMMQHVMARNESLQSTGTNPLTLAISKVISDKAGQTE